MAKLTANTVVRHPETGAAEVLLAGEEVPDWALPRKGEDGKITRLIGDHLVDGNLELPEDEGGLPPKAGKGSGLEAWQKYATDNGIEYAEDASRDEIIVAVEAHQADK